MITDSLYKRLGINKDDVSRKLGTMDDLRNSTPGMVIGVAKDNFFYSINNTTPQVFKKGEGKILSMYMYMKLEKNGKEKNQLRPGRDTFGKLYNKYEGEDLNGKSLLVWRTGGIGDLCFIQPNLIWLKKTYPDSRIVFSCGPQYTSLVEDWDCIDDLVDFPPASIWLHKCNYHLTFEGVIERCVEAESTNSYKLFSRWMGTKVPEDELVPVLKTKPEYDVLVDKYLEENSIKEKEYVAIQLRASSPIRTPSSTIWKQIIDYILKKDLKVILIDGPHFADKIDVFRGRMFDTSEQARIFNYARFSENIKHGMSILNKAKCVIAPDSSMVHLSAGLGVPILGLYGAFTGDIRMSTYKNADWIEPPENKEVCDFGGKQCFIHSQVPCRFTTKKGSCVPCYDHYDMDEMYTKIDKLLICGE